MTVRCGYFIIIKDTRNLSFWKEPYHVPRIPDRVGLEIAYSGRMDGKDGVESEIYRY